MRELVSSRIAVILSAVFVALTAATTTSPALAASETPLYLPAGSVDGVTLIGPPTPRDSAAYAEQMAIVLWLQRTRTAEQIAFVSKELDVGRFTPILGDALFTVDGAALKRTIDAVRDDCDTVKDAYDVSRPFHANPDVEPVGQDVRPVASYPSGNAIRATVYGRQLPVVFPDRKDALTTLADQVGYGRVIAGVHYPEDIVAGKSSATT